MQLVAISLFSVHFHSWDDDGDKATTAAGGLRLAAAFPASDPADWPDALVLAVQLALELLDCFVRAARLELLQEAPGIIPADDDDAAQVRSGHRIGRSLVARAKRARKRVMQSVWGLGG